MSEIENRMLSIRVRVTKATLLRAEMIRTIIARLRESDLSFVEIQALLKFSPSGARSYMKDLRKCGVVYIPYRIGATSRSIGVAVYALVEDDELVEAFLAMIDNPANVGTPKGAPKSRHTDPSRHFHIMADDANPALRIKRARIPAPDPVLAAFYGMVAAC
jgi:hypothetical protein